VHNTVVDTCDPGLSVCLAAVGSWPVAESLAMLRRIGARRFGILAATVGSQGWDSTMATVAASGSRLEYIAGGARAMHDSDDGWTATLGHLRRAVDAAARNGVPTVCFTSGGSGALSWEEAADRAVDRFAPLVEYARGAGVALALENTMSIRSGISFVHTVADAAELARRLEVGLCVDLYSAFQERALMGTLAANLDAIRLVQIGDHRVEATSVPNRFVPGEGHIPLERLVREVRGLGYTGLIDLELVGPAIDADPEAALDRGLAWMRSNVPVLSRTAP